MGLFAIRSAYMLGAESVIAIDRFAERLKLAKHAGGAAPAAAAGERSDGLHRRVAHHNVGKLPHFLGHGGKRQILITLDQASEAAGILLWEKSLGSFHEEIKVQADGAKRNQQNEELMAENPAERDVVGTEKTIEGAFRKTVKTIVLSILVAQETRAHHRRGRERNEK